MMRHLSHDIVITAFFSAINLPVLNKMLGVEVEVEGRARLLLLLLL